MPRKRWLARLSYYEIPIINPEDRNAVSDHDLGRHVLVDFEEVAVLPPELHKQLVADLVVAIRRARGGIKAGKRHVSDKASGKHIFMSDLARAMGRAGLPATRWQKWCDNGSQESLYFRLAHALSDAFRLNLPKDLKPLARWAAQIQYGEMSPGMAAVQAAELAWQQRLGELRVWGDHLVDPPRTCEELASAYLGFPF